MANRTVLLAIPKDTTILAPLANHVPFDARVVLTTIPAQHAKVVIRSVVQANAQRAQLQIQLQPQLLPSF